MSTSGLMLVSISDVESCQHLSKETCSLLVGPNFPVDMWGQSRIISVLFHRSCILLLRGAIEHVQFLDPNSQHKGFPHLSLENS